jgi:hypothetical protein
MHPIDQIMERASERLLAMDYPECERLCLEALAAARQTEDFERYARILLPLQEARRQRRQMAVDAGIVVLGEPKLTPEQILARYPRGCLMLLPPYTQEDERAIRELTRNRSLIVEILVLSDEGLRQCFEQQMEREGDAAVAAVPRGLSPAGQVDALAAVVDRIGDHEVAHQRLADAARAAARGS